jgi:hypothetical protein
LIGISAEEDGGAVGPVVGVRDPLLGQLRRARSSTWASDDGAGDRGWCTIRTSAVVRSELSGDRREALTIEPALPDRIPLATQLAMSMRPMTSRSIMASASAVPSQDTEVPRSHAFDERSVRGTGEPCSRDHRRRLIRIVVAVVALCVAILVAAAIAHIGRMERDAAASSLGSAHAFPTSIETTHSNVSAPAVANATPLPVSGFHGALVAGTMRIGPLSGARDWTALTLRRRGPS